MYIYIYISNKSCGLQSKLTGNFVRKVVFFWSWIGIDWNGMDQPVLTMHGSILVKTNIRYMRR